MLTEAVSVTITALFVPILSVLLGLADSREALVALQIRPFSYFFGWFCRFATALNVQKIDQMIANKIMQLARGRLSVAVLYLFVATAFFVHVDEQYRYCCNDDPTVNDYFKSVRP